MFVAGLSTLAAQGISCPAWKTMKAVKVDDGAHRVFVETSAQQIKTPARAKTILTSMQPAIRQCRSEWGDAWSASFFSAGKYAGYKDDPALEVYVRDGSWARAWIGEYDRKTQQLTLNPADPQKTRRVKIALR